MNTRKFIRLMALILSVAICASVFAACSQEKTDEEKYAEAYELLASRNYEAAYALFVELGDYKDAAKEAAYFRYIPTAHRCEYTTSEESDTVTYTVTLNDKNLPGTIVEEYGSGLKHTCTFTHNEFGHVTRRACSDTEGTTTLYVATYDANGKLLSETVTDKDGNVSEFDYTYNEKGELATVVTTNAPDYYLSYTYTYDAQGREICAVSVYEDGFTTEETTYNEAGNILKKTWTESDGSYTTIYDYVYDEKGRLVEILFTENGEDDGYRRVTYNDKDLMLTEHVFYAFGYEYTYNYEYDAHGNATKTIYHNENPDYGDDVTVSTYTLVYLPYDYTEEEWIAICDSTQCWDVTHF